MDVFTQMAALQKAQRRQLDLLNRCLDRIEQLEWLVKQDCEEQRAETAVANLLDRVDAEALAHELDAPAPAKGGAA